MLRWLLPAVFLLSACTQEEPVVQAERGTPEYVASEFFVALYNDKDLQQAKALATKEYADLMESYGSVRQVSRTMMNMSFDSVEVRVNPSSGNLREQYEDNAEIAIVLTGMHDGKKIDEMRIVELVEQRGRWLVSTVQVDKFSSGAR